MPSAGRPETLSLQLQQALGSRIETGEFGPGALLPSEHEICREYGVSRVTVRRALDALRDLGLITRRQGLGTFVAQRPGRLRSRMLTTSIGELLGYAGVPPIYVEAAKAIVLPPPDVAAGLRQDPTHKLTCLDATVLIKGARFAVVSLYYPDDIGALIELADLDRGQLMIEIVIEKLGQPLSHALQVIDPAIAGARLADRLGIKRGRAVMRVLRTYYLAGGRPVQVAVLYYNPDLYEFSAELRP